MWIWAFMVFLTVVLNCDQYVGFYHFAFIHLSAEVFANLSDKQVELKILPIREPSTYHKLIKCQVFKLTICTHGLQRIHFLQFVL